MVYQFLHDVKDGNPSVFHEHVMYFIINFINVRMRSKDPVMKGVMTFQGIWDSHLAVFPIFLVFLNDSK